MSTTFAKINDVDLGLVFEIKDDGTIVSRYPLGPASPEVVHVEGERAPKDIEIQPGAMGEVWSAWSTGRSGQYLYQGAVMHPSEFIGGGFERDMLAEPGIYVAVEVRDADGQFPEGDPIGWVVLRYEGHDPGCQYCAAGEPMEHTYQRKDL